MQNQLDPMTALGQMTWLASHTPTFGDHPLKNIAETFQCAIARGTFRIYASGDGRPLACVTWACLTAEGERLAEEQAINGAPSRIKEEWLGGDRLWGLCFIAPFGHAKQVCSDLRRNVFPGRPLRGFRTYSSGRSTRLAWAENSSRLSAVSAHGTFEVVS